MALSKIRRRTPQRAVILEELCAMRTHPTAAELFARVRGRLPRISLGTVYRNLEVLHGEGLVVKLGLAGTETRFDGTTRPHDHIRCLRCGLIKDLPSTVTDQLQDADLAGFEVHGHRLEYFGICPACRSAGRDALHEVATDGPEAAH